MTPVEQMRKAVVAAVGGALAAAVPVVQDGAVSLADWCIIAGSAVAVGAGVYWTPNAEAAPAEAGDAPDQVS